jgi:hypothetical protein
MDLPAEIEAMKPSSWDGLHTRWKNPREISIKRFLRCTSVVTYTYISVSMFIIQHTSNGGRSHESTIISQEYFVDTRS